MTPRGSDKERGTMVPKIAYPQMLYLFTLGLWSFRMKKVGKHANFDMCRGKLSENHHFWGRPIPSFEGVPPPSPPSTFRSVIRSSVGCVIIMYSYFSAPGHQLQARGMIMNCQYKFICPRKREYLYIGAYWCFFAQVPVKFAKMLVYRPKLT